MGLIRRLKKKSNALKKANMFDDDEDDTTFKLEPEHREREKSFKPALIAVK
jgi:hypothetical protein